ncbi:uncharacterized protein K489DRAFT_48493 [Dissoconium aciculare CBS 342.82]|uniref:Uncharacterized protein n=1 Tax=Dissoconium aciculare CBS 342.82 TaxID=1314786 RepID=A0A6J3LWP2_9PEZI|nr:uncharacterized protein K489DRAFT_48493 [Dissoconium aciculare CBS 342.82]KAF1820181.1 hypothetical protein K489DRAFT_48493 [Dissoconium aciculare CBS 342.82]
MFHTCNIASTYMAGWASSLIPFAIVWCSRALTTMDTRDGQKVYRDDHIDRGGSAWLDAAKSPRPPWRCPEPRAKTARGLHAAQNLLAGNGRSLRAFAECCDEMWANRGRRERKRLTFGIGGVRARGPWDGWAA